MKKFLKPLGVVLMTCATSISAAAQAQQYFCSVSSDTWIIPSEILIQYSGAVATITHGWIEGPMVRQVQVRGSGNRSNMSYTVPNVTGFGSARATLRFSIRHTRSNNALRVTVNPVEYNNTFTASGSCNPA